LRLDQGGMHGGRGILRPIGLRTEQREKPPEKDGTKKIRIKNGGLKSKALRGPMDQVNKLLKQILDIGKRKEEKVL